MKTFVDHVYFTSGGRYPFAVVLRTDGKSRSYWNISPASAARLERVTFGWFGARHWNGDVRVRDVHRDIE